MKNKILSTYLLSILIGIHLFKEIESNCTINREVLDIVMKYGHHPWSYDYDDDDIIDKSSEEEILHDYEVNCENVILNPEKSLQSQITGLYQEETNKAKTITLSQSQLSNISIILFENINSVSSLNLSNSSINFIEPGALDMPELTILHLENNKLTEIINGSFSRLIKIEEIYLQNNQITLFESFKYNKNLKTINLGNNSITTITEEHFQNLTELQILYLPNNNISTIHPNAFLSLINLQKIDLQKNALKTLPDLLFKNCTYLISTDLSDNYLKNLTFEAMTYQKNKLMRISPLSPSYHYGFINFYSRLLLINNNLTSIPKNLKILQNNPLTLNLNNNNIKIIGSNDFNNMTETIQIFLKQNQIDTIEVGAFKDLKTLHILDLSHNKLKDLTHGLFTGLDHLVFLNLSHNEFIYFDSTVFYAMSLLREIDFSGNYLHSLNTTAIYLPRVSIYLDFYRISCHRLVQYLHALKLHGITVRKGKTFNTENINGIACEHKKILNHTSTTISSLDTITPISKSKFPDVSASSTQKAANLSEISADLIQSDTVKNSHVLLITSIILLIAVITGIIFWFGKKYYQNKVHSHDNGSESQYSLINIRN